MRCAQISAGNRVQSRAHSYFTGWTGTSIESRLMRGNLFTWKLTSPSEPPLHARSSPAVETRIRSNIGFAFASELLRM